MKILGIETSCDETAAAVVTAEGEILSSVVASQMEVHAPFGGVVPELASRQHLRLLPGVVEQALVRAGVSWEGLGGIAVTRGPGLMGSLLVGLTFAKTAAWARDLPWVGVNHLEGHLLSAELGTAPLPRPFIGLVASGGHTNLYRVSSGEPAYRLLARTRDDAVGEAFDKVAKLLGLPYPGGPAIQDAAGGKEPGFLRFTSARMKDGTLAFSFSGIKTAVRYYLQAAAARGETVDAGEVAAAFQQAVVEDLVAKALRAVQDTGARALALTGGVAANEPLRRALSRAAAGAGVPFFVPAREWCTDNAAMIALAGVRHLAAGERSAWDLPAVPYLELD